MEKIIKIHNLRRLARRAGLDLQLNFRVNRTRIITATIIL